MSTRIGRRQGTVNDDGFTLVELIIAVVIIGVISVPLTGVILSYLKNSDATTARLLESHDAQIASAYWAQDVASVGVHSPASPYPLTQSVETSVVSSSSLFPCGTTWTTPTTAPIVTLAWDDFSGAGASVVKDLVAYVVRTDTGETQLHRLRCNGSATAVSDTTVAHNLDPSTPPTVGCFGQSGNSTACSAAPLVPETITLTLTLKNAGNRGAAYIVPLTGQRRQS